MAHQLAASTSDFLKRAAIAYWGMWARLYVLVGNLRLYAGDRRANIFIEHGMWMLVVVLVGVGAALLLKSPLQTTFNKIKDCLTTPNATNCA